MEEQRKQIELPKNPIELFDTVKPIIWTEWKETVEPIIERKKKEENVFITQDAQLKKKQIEDEKK